MSVSFVINGDAHNQNLGCELFVKMEINTTNNMFVSVF